MASPLVQVKEIWSKLPLAGRISVIAAAVGTLGLLAAVVYYGSQAEYAVLFSDLKPTDAQAIVEKLKASNVPYSLSNNNTTVSVPAERVAEMRLEMASSGVLSGGHVGFDLFDKTSFGATDFTQQVNYRRAIEGELAKTLEGMDEVEQARVHLTPKKESIFTEKEEGAKASVMLRVRQGKELSQERTDAIVSLLSSAIEGLDPSSISVMDTRGRLLTAAGSKRGAFSDAGAFHAQLEAKQKFEAETAARVITLLEPISGDGKVRADVSADVDFSQVEQTEEKYNPQSQVIRSQQTSQEVRNSAQNQNPAVGARANDPTIPPVAAPQQNTQNNDQRQAMTTNYEIDKTVRRTVGGGGRINRMSVSVVLDHKNVNGVQTARTPEELKQIQDLVSAAVGVDGQRGDAVVVQTMPFDKPQIDEAQKGWTDRLSQMSPLLVKYGALILVALLLLLFVVRPARRALTAAAPQPEPILLPPAEVPALAGASAEILIEEERREVEILEENAFPIMEEVPQLTAMKTVAELEAEMNAQTSIRETISVTPPVDAQRTEMIRVMIEEEIFKEPELVAGTLRSWLQETQAKAKA